MRNIADTGRSFAAQRGASMIEAAITLPVFMILILALASVSQILYSWIELHEAVYTAARDGANQMSNCDAAAASKFSEAMTGSLSPFASAPHLNRTPVPASVAATGLRFYSVAGEAEVRCVACPLLQIASGSAFTVRAAHAVPYENQDSGC